MDAARAVPMAPASEEVGWLGSVDSAVNSLFEPISAAFNTIVFFPVTIGDLSFPIVVAWLIVAGVVFTFYFGFIQFRGLRVAAQVVRGKFSSKDDPGEVPHFQALTSALSGTVGLGNIAGVGAG